MAKKNDVFVFSKTNVSKYVQKKMGLSYLNWAFVVDTLKTNDPSATYSVKQYPEIDLKTHQLTGRKVNYFAGINGNDAYVTVTVTFNGKSHTESLPCYNFKGQAVQIPDAMLVNKTIKRCFVKAAAMLTGLGIGLYINGSTMGVGQHGNRNHYSNKRKQSSGVNGVKQNVSNNSHNRNGGRFYSASKNVNNTPSDKQVNFIKGLLKQAKSNGSKAYVYLYSNRNDLKNALDGPSASKAIKYLQKLIKSQKSHVA